MIEKCGISGCGRKGHLGNSIRYVKVHDSESGKEISLPMCSKCKTQIPTRKRPK